MQPINVGLLGIGTVGRGTWDVLNRNADEIQRRAGRAIQITQVADKAVRRARKITGKKAKVTGDAFKLVRDPQIDIIVELIGGYTVAKELVLAAIRNGKHVVTANKALLTTLSALAFGIPMQFKKCFKEGIQKLTRADIGYAEALGYRIKLLGITRRAAKGIELRVHPTLVPTRRLIANVEGVMNGILVKGDAVGPTLYYGAGAGSQPTASAVVADLIDITRLITADPGHRVPHLAFQPDQLSDTPILPIGEVETSYYLRMRVIDKPGVLADITRILAGSKISIDAMVQKEPEKGESRVDIVLLTHLALEKNVNQAMAKIEKLSTVVGKVTRIRLEELL